MGRDRLRLHEPQPGRARRPRVRLHRRPASASRARPSSATSRDPAVTARRSAPGRAPPPDCAARPHAEARPLRRQHALRRRHRGRQDRGRARASACRSTPGASTSWRMPWTRPPTPTSTPSSPSTTTSTTSSPELRAGGERHESLRYGARDRARACAPSSRPAASRAFTTSFEDLGALQQLPGLAVQRLMADGYGFGAEGDWKTAVLVRVATVMGAGLPGGASLMEDYTYHLDARQRADPRRAHARGQPVADAPRRPSLEIHPLGIGGKDDPVRLVFTADPGPAVVVALSDMRDRFRLVANVVENVALPAAAAEAARRPRRLEAGARLRDQRRRLAHRRRRAPHRDDDAGRRRGVPRLRRRCRAPSCSSSTRTPPSAVSSARCAGTPRTTDWRRGICDPRTTCRGPEPGQVPGSHGRSRASTTHHHHERNHSEEEVSSRTRRRRRDDAAVSRPARPPPAAATGGGDGGLIGVAMPTKSSERWIADGNALKETLEEQGFTVDLQYAEDDIPTQVTQIENMITKGAEALIIASIDGTTLTKVLQEAADGDIPVIAYDRLIRDSGERRLLRDVRQLPRRPAAGVDPPERPRPRPSSTAPRSRTRPPARSTSSCSPVRSTTTTRSSSSTARWTCSSR